MKASNCPILCTDVHTYFIITLYHDSGICVSSNFMKLRTQVKLAFIFHLFFFFPANSYLVLKKRKPFVFCTENRSPTCLVSSNMQNTESVLREMENCASFVFVVLGWWVGGMEAILQICLSTLSSLSILIQHIGAGVVKLPQPASQI